MSNHTVIVADDQAVFRSLVERLLKPDYELLAIARDGMELMAFIHAHHPDVVVSDVGMPHLNGIEAIARAQMAGSLERGENTPTAVVFLTVHQDQTLVDRALSVGALGYVLKPRAALDLLPAIAAARRGEQFVSPPLHVPLRQ